MLRLMKIVYSLWYLWLYLRLKSGRILAHSFLFEIRTLVATFSSLHFIKISGMSLHSHWLLLCFCQWSKVKLCFALLLTCFRSALWIHALLQGIFPTQGSNPGLLHCRLILYHLSHEGSPRILEGVAYPFFRDSSQPKNQTGLSCIAGRFFTSWATRESMDMWIYFVRMSASEWN